MKHIAIVARHTWLPMVWLCLALGVAPALAQAAERRFEVQAHRGGADLWPESSMTAFEGAIGLGVDTLEMDVQSTSDRVLVISHDQKVAAGCRKPGGEPPRSRLFKELTLAEVQELRCRDGEAIPTLEEVLLLARDAPYPVGVNVEIKLQKASRALPIPELARALATVLEETGMRDRALVQSFEPEALLAMREVAPEIPRAVLARARSSFLKRVEETDASVLLPRHDRLRREDVERFHQLGVRVIPWVVDDPKKMERLRSWGVDGVITDRPDLALAVRDGSAPER